MKGRIVFLGNNVRDEDGQAYIQSPLGGAETYIRLPKELKPDSWKHMRDPVCKLVMSLYGHPDAGGFWQAHCKNALESVGFIEVSESWQSLFYHPELKVMMAVYVDDFKASGPVEALKKAWTLVRSKIRTGAPTPKGRYLGCHRNVVELKDRRVIEYDTHDFLEQCVSHYKKVCGENVVLKKASTPFLDEDKLPEEDDNEPGKLADAACSVLMKVLYGARLARFDLFKAVAGLASKVTKWSVSCDKRLFRLMCYINDSKGLKMRGYVGRDDKAEDLFVRLSAAADFAGCRDTARSTSGVFLGPKVCQLLKCLTKSLVELTESAFVGCTKFFKMDNARQVPGSNEGSERISGVLELHAMLGTELNITGRQKLAYVAHSQGTAQMFIAASDGHRTESQLHTWLREHVSIFVALSPIAWLGHSNSLLLKALADVRIQDLASLFFPLGFRTPGSWDTAAHILCKLTLGVVCKIGVDVVCGHGGLDPASNVEGYSAHFPFGSSVKDMAHFSQLLRSGEFARYDYGRKDNDAIYGQPSPPAYNVSNLGVPTALFIGEEDKLADSLDVYQLMVTLGPTKQVVYSKRYAGFSHVTWTLGSSGAAYYVSDVLDVLQSHHASPQILV
ncbi:unnamed protein product [Polarella glacialis]|uniref:Uncharacterized protein n=1 Tax=Polarella glacialis TaxID=89957 RepID=A0A813GSM4_POLGL|nr:unnamed protein product [Polarella glacialis]